MNYVERRKRERQFSSLVGETLSKVENTGDEIIFESTSGRRWKLYHEQDCCESVQVEDVIGNLDDLIGSPITMAEEVTNADRPIPVDKYPSNSETWTFYKLATIKGYVTIRFLGESNGYYSESVDFIELT